MENQAKKTSIQEVKDLMKELVELNEIISAKVRNHIEEFGIKLEDISSACVDDIDLNVVKVLNKLGSPVTIFFDVKEKIWIQASVQDLVMFKLGMGHPLNLDNYTSKGLTENLWKAMLCKPEIAEVVQKHEITAQTILTLVDTLTAEENIIIAQDENFIKIEESNRLG